MKKIVFSSVVASAMLWACNKPAQTEVSNENTPEDTSVVAQERPTGGDQDEHGCNILLLRISITQSVPLYSSCFAVLSAVV